jgi:hypothetical protein
MTIEYKGFSIDVGVTYEGQISVQYLGDDVFFYTVEDAKNWIDSLENDSWDDDDDECDCWIERYEHTFRSFGRRGVRSSTGGDYSPSNPWDAPGMSVRDFI